jgi:AcrR family transcriptional regulator
VAALICAAVVVMARRGSYSPTITEILDEAGLSNQAFYRHFESKDEFLLAIVDDGLRQLLNYLEHELAKAETPVERIRCWVRGVLTQSIRHDAAEATRGVLASSSHLRYTAAEEFARCEEVLERPLREALSDAQQDGTIGPRELERDVRAIYQLIIGWTEVAVARQSPTTDQDVAHLTQFVLDALGIATQESIERRYRRPAARAAGTARK